MACRIRELLYSGNHFRTNKCAALCRNSMIYHSSQDVYDMQWYRSEFPNLIKMTQLLANVDTINGRLVDVNSNSSIFGDQIENDMHTFKSLVRVFIGSPFVQDKMRRVLASNSNTQHDTFTPFSKTTEREPRVIDSLTKVSNFLDVSAQQRKVVRFKVCPQVTQHHIWTGALKETLNNFAVDLDSLASQGSNECTILGQQIIHSCLKFLTETASFSDADSSSWMKYSPTKIVNSSDSQKWEDVLAMFNDLIKCCKSETRLKSHVAKVEVMKEGLLHIKDITIDNSIAYKDARYLQILVQKKLSKTLGHSSGCLFTLLQYYLYGRVTDIEVDLCGGIYKNGNDSKFCLSMGRILTSDSERMVGRGVKQLDRALGLFKFVWETAGMKGHLDLQGHLWCVGADNRMLRYRGNMYFVHGWATIAFFGVHCYVLRGLTCDNYGIRNFVAGMVGLSLGEQHFIQGGIAQDLRCDGRKRLTYRPIQVETGVIPQANGSARVRIGATEVIASVKAELGKPSSMQPDKGKVFIYIDCSSTAEPAFEGRGGEELSAELSTALQRCLLGAKSGAGAGIDRTSLVVVEGKICWDIYIDGLVVSSDGNLLDALGAAIKAALSNTGIPSVKVAAGASSDEQPEVDVSDEEFLQFDTSGIPVIVTLTKVGRHYIVDATPEEESQMSSAVSISINRKGHICGITKRGGAGLDPSVILDMVSVAKHVSEQLMNKLDSEIASAEAEDES